MNPAQGRRKPKVEDYSIEEEEDEEEEDEDENEDESLRSLEEIIMDSGTTEKDLE